MLDRAKVAEKAKEKEEKERQWGVHESEVMKQAEDKAAKQHP